MKMNKCQLKGVLDSDGCFTCFNQGLNGEPMKMQVGSRVHCKEQNIIDSFEVTMEPETVAAVK